MSPLTLCDAWQNLAGLTCGGSGLACSLGLMVETSVRHGAIYAIRRKVKAKLGP
jgi:hypothetical protein